MGGWLGGVGGGVTSISHSFQGSESFLEKPPKTLVGNGDRFWKRTMAEKNGESTPSIKMVAIPEPCFKSFQKAEVRGYFLLGATRVLIVAHAIHGSVP